MLLLVCHWVNQTSVENWQLMEQFTPWRGPTNPKGPLLALGKI